MGEDGVILKTTDWGGTWTPQNSGTTNRLNNIYFLNDSVGVAVGEGGIILLTKNGGANWTKQASGTIENLLAVDGDGNSKLIAVGNNGTIVGSISKGMIWNPQVSKTLVHLPDVILMDEPFATVVGHNGTILRTTDGGITWIPQESGTTENLLSISFSDKNNGSAAGENGTVLHTKTGGKTLPIIFVDNSKPNGDGTFTNPFNNLNDALTAAGSVDSVYVMNSEEQYFIDGSWTTLNMYEKFLIGQGVELKWEGFTLVPASNPPIITNPNGDGVRVGNKTTIAGFRIENCKGAGIYVGPDVTDSVRVIKTTITGGKNGIKIDGSTGLFYCSEVWIIDTNVEVLDCSGTLDFTNTDIIYSFPSPGINIDGGQTEVTYNGNITQDNDAPVIEINNHNTGVVTFQNGTIKATKGTG